jgi:hypothetical protein
VSDSSWSIATRHTPKTAQTDCLLQPLVLGGNPGIDKCCLEIPLLLPDYCQLGEIISQGIGHRGGHGSVIPEKFKGPARDGQNDFDSFIHLSLFQPINGFIYAILCVFYGLYRLVDFGFQTRKDDCKNNNAYCGNSTNNQHDDILLSKDRLEQQGIIERRYDLSIGARNLDLTAGLIFC